MSTAASPGHSYQNDLQTLPSVVTALQFEVMHTHFASGTLAISTFISVVIVGTLWKLGWARAAQSQNPTIRALASAALFQYN